MSPHGFLLRVILAFTALYAIWGSTYYAIQLAGREVPPLLMAGGRFLIAGALLLFCCRWLRLLRSCDFAPRNWFAALGVGLGLMLIGNGGVAYAVQRIPTGISAVIVGLTPMWLVLFDWAQRRNGRPSNGVFLGIALGVAGIATLKLAEGSTDAALDPVGIAITVMATLGWAAGSIWSRTAPRPASPVTACAMQMLMGGVLLVIASASIESWTSFDPAALTWRFWASWWYLILFGSLVGFTAYIWLLQHVSAAKVGTYAYVNPIIALLIGIAMNGERFTLAQLLACALILTGVVVLTMSRGRVRGAGSAGQGAVVRSDAIARSPNPEP
jgi:drug/metabolite transporter (DMT)-like permease